jgi:hypothetical protein
MLRDNELYIKVIALFFDGAARILVKRILIPKVSYSERHHAPSAKQREEPLDIFRRPTQMTGTKSVWSKLIRPLAPMDTTCTRA